MDRNLIISLIKGISESKDVEHLKLIGEHEDLKIYGIASTYPLRVILTFGLLHLLIGTPISIVLIILFYGVFKIELILAIILLIYSIFVGYGLTETAFKEYQRVKIDPSFIVNECLVISKEKEKIEDFDLKFSINKNIITPRIQGYQLRSSPINGYLSRPYHLQDPLYLPSSGNFYVETEKGSISLDLSEFMINKWKQDQVDVIIFFYFD